MEGIVARATFLRLGEQVQTIDADGMTSRSARRYAARNGMTGAVVIETTPGGSVQARVLRGDGSYSVIRMKADEPKKAPTKQRSGDRRTGRVRRLKVDDRPVAE